MTISVIVGKNNFDRKSILLDSLDTPRKAINETGFSAEAEGRAIHMNAVPLTVADLDKTFESLGVGERAIITWNIAKPDNA